MYKRAHQRIICELSVSSDESDELDCEPVPEEKAGRHSIQKAAGMAALMMFCMKIWWLLNFNKIFFWRSAGRTYPIGREISKLLALSGFIIDITACRAFILLKSRSLDFSFKL